jgi:hypothetical protein
MPVPRDPGRIIVRVLDQVGAPVQNAYACIEQPSAVGNQFKTCSWTGRDGMTLPHTVASGRRPVDVTLPAGFSAGPEGLIREVDLVKDRTLTVDFNVRRN